MSLSKLKETIETMDEMSPESLQGLVEETVSAFHTIQAKITSPKEEERDEALEVANELKGALEAQLQNLQAQLGMSTEQIEEYLADADNFSPEEFQSMEKARIELAQFSK